MTWRRFCVLLTGLSAESSTMRTLRHRRENPEVSGNEAMSTLRSMFSEVTPDGA